MRRVTDAMVGSLRERLVEMGPQERAELVARHPQAYANPRPRTLHQLAVRLLGNADADIDHLDQGELQLLEAAVSAAGGHGVRRGPLACPRTALEALLGVGSAVTSERVEEVLDSLAARLLALPHGDRVLVHPGAAGLFRAPLGRRTERDPKPTGRAPLLQARPGPKARAATRQDTAGVAAAAALQRLDRLLEFFADASWPALKKGGISVKEVRRLGRLLHVPEEEARLWLHLAAELDLIEAKHGRWQPTGQAGAWCRADPAARLADLGGALLGMTALPLLSLPDPSRPNQTATALSSGASVREAWQIRRAVLRVLAGLPDGQGALVDQDLAAAVYYRCPTAFTPYRHRPPLHGDSLLSYMSIWCTSMLEAEAVTAAVMREAELLALTADGALTGLGRALTDGRDGEHLQAAAAELLPLQDKAAVLADHLVVVPGVPTPGLQAVLEDLCDLEHRDAHTQSWRISPTSVRRYFDTHPGAHPPSIIGRLEGASSTPIPQTVVYLITDTANRHGHITVSKSRAVLDVQNEGLAVELAHHKALRHLGLRQAGPTVLLAEADLSNVLKALRDAGYAPSSRLEEATAQPAPARRTTKPYEIPLQLRGHRTETPAKDYPQWVADLPTDVDLADSAPLAGHIRELAPALGGADCEALAAAIESGTRVHVEYRTGNGGYSTMTVNEPRIEGRSLAGKARRYPLPLSMNTVQLVLPLPRSGKKTP